MNSLFIFNLQADSLSFSRVNYQFTIFLRTHFDWTLNFVDKLSIHFLFSEHTMNLLEVPQIYNKFTIFFGIYYKSSDLIKNLVRIHWKFPKNHSKLSIFFANQLWTYSLFREFTINQRDVSRINYELTIFFANLL